MNRFKAIILRHSLIVVSVLIGLSFPGLLFAQDKPAPKSLSLLKIGCYDTEDPVAVGKKTTYVLEVWNDGASPATNITIEYQIPGQMTFASAKATPGLNYKAEGNTLKFEPYPILNPGAKLTYRIACNVVEEGLAEAKATLTYDQFDQPIYDIERTSTFK